MTKKWLSIFGFLVVLVFLVAGCKKEKEEEEPQKPNFSAIGSAARALLSDEKFTSLHVEIAYVTGFEPRQESLQNMGSFLEELLNKPKGITWSARSIIPQGKSAYTLEDLKSVEAAYREQEPNGDRLTVWLFFADAGFHLAGATGQILGVAYGGTSMAVFQKVVQQNSGSFFQPTRIKLESTVIQHEFGHILGLVDLGSAMHTPHEGEDKHCDNPDCLMFHTVETTGFISKLNNSNIPVLDQNCRNDLKANGGK